MLCFSKTDPSRDRKERNMLKGLAFERGINLGGWMSQCDYSEDRLNHFITEEDIARIASWGLDHVRLPVDYNVLETEDGSEYRADGFARISRAYGWCRTHGLNLVIDLHKTAGFSFDAGEQETGFFESASCQERFYRLWEQIAARCGDSPEHVAFELLNEVTDPAFIGAWNRIARTCIRRIRAICPRHLILVGSYHNNSAAAVPALDPPLDDRVIYNFHCYEPLAFTHQGAHWVPQLDRNQRISFEEAGIPEDYFDRLFAPALEAARKNGTELYCGEYGVIDQAEPESAVKWFRLIHAAFARYGIGHSIWSYREMDFGLADARMDGYREQILE